MKVVRCSYINTFLYGRLLDVRISIRFYMEGTSNNISYRGVMKYEHLSTFPIGAL
jgi:hypothetical protein